MGEPKAKKSRVNKLNDDRRIANDILKKEQIGILYQLSRFQEAMDVLGPYCTMLRSNKHQPYCCLKSKVTTAAPTKPLANVLNVETTSQPHYSQQNQTTMQDTNCTPNTQINGLHNHNTQMQNELNLPHIGQNYPFIFNVQYNSQRFSSVQSETQRSYRVNNTTDQQHTPFPNHMNARNIDVNQSLQMNDMERSVPISEAASLSLSRQQLHEPSYANSYTVISSQNTIQKEINFNNGPGDTNRSPFHCDSSMEYDLSPSQNTNSSTGMFGSLDENTNLLDYLLQLEST